MDEQAAGGSASPTAAPAATAARSPARPRSCRAASAGRYPRSRRACGPCRACPRPAADGRPASAGSARQQFGARPSSIDLVEAEQSGHSPPRPARIGCSGWTSSARKPSGTSTPVVVRQAVDRQHLLDRRLVPARAAIDALEAEIAADHHQPAAVARHSRATSLSRFGHGLAVQPDVGVQQQRVGADVGQDHGVIGVQPVQRDREMPSPPRAPACRCRSNAAVLQRLDQRLGAEMEGHRCRTGRSPCSAWRHSPSSRRRAGLSVLVIAHVLDQLGREHGARIVDQHACRSPPRSTPVAPQARHEVAQDVAVAEAAIAGEHHLQEHVLRQQQPVAEAPRRSGARWRAPSPRRDGHCTCWSA